MAKREPRREQRTSTSSFGVGRREGHDASSFYARFSPPILSDDETINRPQELLDELGRARIFLSDGRQMDELPDNSVALVVTSPPYFVGKEYELAVAGQQSDGHGESRRAEIPGTYVEFLDKLRAVFTECARVLEPGGRIAVNVANLGRKPYRSLSADVISILQDDLGLLLRGEVIWEKATSSSGSCAWGSFARASNPVLRDLTERVVIASKGRFSRAISAANRRKRGLPHRSTITNDEFVDVTRDVWRIDPESATAVGHPAPFPVDLPRRLIDLYTYQGDIVLDPFVGSGTTVVAALRTGRIGVGYDNDPEYVELAEQRVAREFERSARLETARDRSANLAPDERQDVVHGSVVAEGRKVVDVARRHLEEAGFSSLKDKPRFPGGLVDVDFSAQGPDRRTWWITVAGGFTTHKPGLQRIDAVWRLLGQATVNKTGQPLLVLTASLPKPGSPADKALRAAGPGLLFDVIELYDPEGRARLAHYATSAANNPMSGFWTTLC
ncbi:MAG: site-specific DNA-methyltransferase [Acidimicrobiia bacterium]|nr:site-specific DNA-methyltransferase [Acidimicrobiia bacterium]